MKAIKLKFDSFNTVATLRLGGIYILEDQYRHKETKCIFIRVSNKGFNFLVVGKNKLFFKRPVYQTQSALKKIGRNQEVFEINMPKWIYEIKGKQEKTLPKFKQCKVEIPEIQTIKNAFDRLQIS